MKFECSNSGIYNSLSSVVMRSRNIGYYVLCRAESGHSGYFVLMMLPLGSLALSNLTQSRLALSTLVLRTLALGILAPRTLAHRRCQQLGYGARVIAQRDGEEERGVEGGGGKG